LPSSASRRYVTVMPPTIARKRKGSRRKPSVSASGEYGNTTAKTTTPIVAPSNERLGRLEKIGRAHV